MIKISILDVNLEITNLELQPHLPEANGLTQWFNGKETKPHRYIEVHLMCTDWSITADFRLPWWRHQMETFSTSLVFVRGIHRSSANSPHKSQWRGALVFSLICAWINGCANNREAGDLRRHRDHYDVTVMPSKHQAIRNCHTDLTVTSVTSLIIPVQPLTHWPLGDMNKILDI